MNDTTKALLKDLQNDLDSIKLLESDIEVVWQLERLKRVIEVTNELILKSTEL